MNHCFGCPGYQSADAAWDECPGCGHEERIDELKTELLRYRAEKYCEKCGAVSHANYVCVECHDAEVARLTAEIADLRADMQARAEAEGRLH